MSPVARAVTAVRTSDFFMPGEHSGLLEPHRVWRPREKALAPVAEVWNHLPIYYYVYVINAMVNGMLTFFPQSRWQYVPSLLFPFAVVLLSYWGKLTAEGFDGARRIRYFWMFTGLVGSYTALTLSWGAITGFFGLGPTPLEHLAAIKKMHEWSSFVTIPLVALHCLWRMGGWRFLMFYCSAFFYGMVLESTGVRLGYFFEPCYNYYLHGFDAPLATMFGWSTVFYPAVVHYDYFKRGFKRFRGLSPFQGGLVLSAIALCIDMVVDPLASNIGLWTWNEAYAVGSYPWQIFDVPVLNFVAWFWAVFAFGSAYLYITEKKLAAWGARKAFVVLTAAVPFIYFVSGAGEMPTMALLEGGFDGPTWNILLDYSAGMPHDMNDPNTGHPYCAPKWIREWHQQYLRQNVAP